MYSNIFLFLLYIVTCVVLVRASTSGHATSFLGRLVFWFLCQSKVVLKVLVTRSRFYMKFQQGNNVPDRDIPPAPKMSEVEAANVVEKGEVLLHCFI